MFSKEKLLAIVFLLIISNFIHCNVQDKDNSRMKLFDLNWKFNFGNNILASNVDFNDQNWRSIDLPHDWSTDTVLHDFIKKIGTATLAPETGWYRKNFEIPKNWIGKRIVIDFEGISGQHEIFINGVSVKHSENSNLETKTDLTPYLNPKGFNLIAIRVVIPNETRSAWKAESGIFRHVWLVIKDTSYFKE